MILLNFGEKHTLREENKKLWHENAKLRHENETLRRHAQQYAQACVESPLPRTT